MVRLDKTSMVRVYDEYGQMYLYFQGQLIYKRWGLKGGHNYGRVFHDREGLTLQTKAK